MTDTNIIKVSDVTNLFQAILQLDDTSRALASGYIQGLATAKTIQQQATSVDSSKA